jgi:phosphoribosylanthranilate isomerase
VTTFIKICGMTDERAIDAAVSAGADAIGFVFHPASPRNLSPEKARALAEPIPSHILKVAVTLHPEVSHWNEIAAVFQPDVLQTDADDFDYLEIEPAIEKWPVLREGALPDGELPDTFIYEGQKSGQGQRVNWNVAARVAQRGKMILAGGLSVKNVGVAIRQVAPFGVDVSSAVESEPGKKDVAKIAAFVAAAKVA